MVINCDTTRFISEVLEKGEYSFLFKNLVIVDLGCNIGAFSLWIYPAASVIHAIDISSQNINNLNETIKANNFGKIKTYQLGIAGHNGSRKIDQKGNDNAGNGGWALGEDEGEVDGYTLNTFMINNKIDYIDILKMDIEGGEIEVINASDFPKDKINTIVGEVHSDQTEFREKLEELGFKYIDVNTGHFIAKR